MNKRSVNFSIPRIYPITDVQLSGTSHTDQAKSLIDGGVRIIQFREKNAAPLDWFFDLCEAVELCRRSNVISIVNDRVDIAMAAGADGVHLGQTDLSPAAARRLLGDSAIIGYSTHTLEQVKQARNLEIDYLAFGPVFPTKTKKDPDAVVGLSLLYQVRELAGDLPLVAIGGIDLGNAASVFEARADSIALISSLMMNGSTITQRTKEFTSRFAQTV